MVLYSIFCLVFAVGVKLSGFTIVRLFLAAWMLPIYLAIAFFRSVLPNILWGLPLLVSRRGRHRLRVNGTSNRSMRESQARKQFRGEYEFNVAMVERTGQVTSVVRKVAKVWGETRRDYVEVCPGVKAAVLRAGTPGGKRVLLLHGNPSWSFMYRNVIPTLAEEGLDVYALDWVGFGMSDKPLVMEHISFELHMKTLLCVFDKYNLAGVHILAHDWGGCVALCTAPYLDEDAVESLMLLNSFFPPRPTDITLNCLLLYYVWLSCQGIFNGFLPESFIIRYMATSVSASTVEGYSAPFSSWRDKKAVSRFAFMVPGMPAVVYWLFNTYAGAVLDGFCPPSTFSSLHEQVRLRERDERTREFWASGRAQPKVALLFGHDDLLLRDFKDVLLRKVKTAKGDAEGKWLYDAGHYPVEERPIEIAERFISLVETGSMF